MLADYLPVLVMLVLATATAALFLGLPVIVPRIFGLKRRASPVKYMPYESGMTPIGQAWRRFPIKFYLTAVLFVLFDIEVIFFYPWAVILRQLKLFGLIEMLIFGGLLFLGYVYVWRSGALEWER